MTGVVAEKNVKRGQYVIPGQPLIALQAEQEAYILANYKETQLARIKPGQSVTFTVDVYPGLRLLSLAYKSYNAQAHSCQVPGGFFRSWQCHYILRASIEQAVAVLLGVL